MQTVNGRGIVLCNASSISGEETLELVREIDNLGSDGALLLPSYFVKLTNDEIVNFNK